MPAIHVIVVSETPSGRRRIVEASGLVRRSAIAAALAQVPADERIVSTVIPTDGELAPGQIVPSFAG